MPNSRFGLGMNNITGEQKQATNLNHVVTGFGKGQKIMSRNNMYKKSFLFRQFIHETPNVLKFIITNLHLKLVDNNCMNP